MRPRAIVWFERVLLAALAIDLVNNLLAWSTLSERVAGEGAAASPTLLLGLAIAPPLVGLVFWYFIARRRSRVAKWLLAAFVALGVAGFALVLARSGDVGADPMVILAGVSELMKVVAVACLFTREASDWLAGGREVEAETP